MIIKELELNFSDSRVSLDDFINEKDLIEKLGIKKSLMKYALYKHKIPYFQIHHQSPRFYLKQEVRDYLLTYRRIKGLPYY